MGRLVVAQGRRLLLEEEASPQGVPLDLPEALLGLVREIFPEHHVIAKVRSVEHGTKDGTNKFATAAHLGDGVPGLIVDRFGPLVVAVDYADGGMAAGRGRARRALSFRAPRHPPDALALNDVLPIDTPQVWQWDASAGTWTDLTLLSGGGPPAGQVPAAATDPATKRIVFFGGQPRPGNVPNDETWTWGAAL